MERVCTGPITYIGRAHLEQDIANLKAALAATNAEQGYMNATAPALGAQNQRNG